MYEREWMRGMLILMWKKEPKHNEPEAQIIPLSTNISYYLITGVCVQIEKQKARRIFSLYEIEHPLWNS